MKFDKRMRLAQEKFAEGDIALDKAKYQKAADTFLEAAELCQNVKGQEQNYASCLLNAANALENLGLYEQSKSLLKKILPIQEQRLGSEHPEVANIWNNLALIYQAQGDYEQAKSLLEKALNIREKVLGLEHPDVATSINNLAAIYQTQGDYEQAKSLLEKALNIREKVLGLEHPDFATSINNLAVIIYQIKWFLSSSDEGDYEQAKSLLERALNIRKKILGSEHPDVANSIHNLAAVYQAQGDYKQAKSLFERALSIREKVLGSEHPDVANSINNLAAIYLAQGDYEQAKSLFERALSIREKVLGLDHPDVAGNLNNLALVYRKLDKIEKAKELQERAIDIYELNHHMDISINNLIDTIIQKSLFYDNSFSYIDKLHEEVLQFLGNKSEKFPNLHITFRTVKNDEQGRLSKGYWFLGDDEQLYFSCWKGIDTTVQMPTIAIVIDTQQQVTLQFNGKDSVKKAAFLADLTKLLDGFSQSSDANGKLEARWRKTYSQETWQQALEEFFTTDKPQIDEYLAINNNAVEDFTPIPEKEFLQSLKFTVFLREKLKETASTEIRELDEVGKPLKLQSLQLENIGHFESVEFDLSRQITILIGENGSGKSTVLKALALGLSNVAKTTDIALIQDYLRILKTEADHEHSYLKKHYCKTGSIRVGFQLNKPQTQTLEFSTSELGGVAINAFVENNDDWLLSSNNRFIDLVLGFPQGKKRGSKTVGKIAAPNLNDLIALIEDRDNADWKTDLKKWLYRLSTEPRAENKEKIDAVFTLFSKIIADELEDATALIRLKDVVYDSETNEEELIVCTPDMPEGIALSLLSQGYNNIFLWIARLLMRLYDTLEVHQQEHHKVSENKFLKNRNTRGKRYEANSIYDLHGIVLIDEIDTYLHPKWQRNILQVLAETFPCLQFVVTSHSLAVLSSLKDKNSYMIYRAFKDDEGQTLFEELDPQEQNPYGADLNSVAQNTMDIPIREPEIQDKLKELRSFIARKNIVKADELVTELKDLISFDDPEFVRLRDRLASEKFTLSE